MADDDLKAAKDAVSRARSDGGSDAKEAVEKLADAINAIIAHLEKRSGGGSEDGEKQPEGGPEGAPEENDLDVSGEPRQFD